MKKLYLSTILLVFLSFFSIGIFTSYGVSAVFPHPRPPSPPPPPPTEDNLAWWCDVVNAEIVWGGFEDAKDVNTAIHGGGINVCIIDTGCNYTHLDLDDNYAGGWDYVKPDNDPMEEGGNYHGTHVAGTIAMEDNEVGYIGIAPRINLYVLRVIDPLGWADAEYINKSLHWAIENEMDIVSMSFGGFEEIDFLNVTLNKAYDAGIVLVAGSGNYYKGWPTNVMFPASHPKVIAVGAVNSDLFRANLSNTGTWGSCYGQGLDLVAPGVNIMTTGKSDTWVTDSGTSLACPIVAGICALMLSKNPNLTPDQIRDILFNSENVIDLGPTGWDEEYGYGMVDADFAVSNVSYPN